MTVLIEDFFNWTVECRVGSAERGAGGELWFHIGWSRHLQMYMNGDSPCFYSIGWILFLSMETSNHVTFVYSVPRLDYPCSGMLGMVSGLISDSQITASNQADRNWMPENIRLVTSRSGWALPPAPHPYVNEWLQVDLAEEKIVRGVIIQGGKHRENKVFMRKFKIGYSNNGSDWKMIMDDSKRKAKVSPGRGRRREGLGGSLEALT